METNYPTTYHGLTVGHRVRMTESAQETFPRLKSYTGTVVGVSVNRAYMRVRRDMVVKADLWHYSFWVPKRGK